MLLRTNSLFFFISKADLHPAPPDVTTGLVDRPHYERPQVASVRAAPRGYGGSVLETADGEHTSLLFLKDQSTVSLCGVEPSFTVLPQQAQVAVGSPP